MKVGYVVETSATSAEEDSKNNDVITWVQYKYDLEIDRSGKIVGGEWHMAVHPDFIWVTAKGARPQSPLDKDLNSSEWDGKTTIPNHWAEAARRGASYGLILDALTTSLNVKAAQ